MSHTPTPWTLEAGRSIVTSSGSFYLSYGSDKATGKPHFENFCELDANARLIVRAVNSHQGLVDALRYALKCLEEVKKDQPMYHFYHYGDVSVDVQGRAALRQAEEVSE